MDWTIWSYLDIEKDAAGWWVVRLGQTYGGDRARERVRFFEAGRLDPGTARYAAHLYAMSLTTPSLRYVA